MDSKCFYRLMNYGDTDDDNPERVRSTRNLCAKTPLIHFTTRVEMLHFHLNEQIKETSGKEKRLLSLFSHKNEGSR